METLNRLLDGIYYGAIVPFFRAVGWLLDAVFIRPLAWLHTPIWLHVILLGILTAGFSLWIRRLLNVDEKVARFNAMFAEKRRRQQNLQYIPDKYSREALYRVTDDELNHDFNTYLANHYARYVTVYLLPLFLILAWLNSVFSGSILSNTTGTPYVLPLPANSFGIHGLTVTAVFLLAYITGLLIGFWLKGRCRR